MTVGLVLVSHSAELAAATAATARALAGAAVTVEPAGGTGDGDFGTSIELIHQAISRADTGAGVVVLMDMGSSVLTAKTLLAELADEPDGDHGAPDVRLADAPFVEGAVAATVLASTGAPADDVARSAEEAWGMRKL